MSAEAVATHDQSQQVLRDFRKAALDIVDNPGERKNLVEFKLYGSGQSYRAISIYTSVTDEEGIVSGLDKLIAEIVPGARDLATINEGHMPKLPRIKLGLTSFTVASEYVTINEQVVVGVETTLRNYEKKADSTIVYLRNTARKPLFSFLRRRKLASSASASTPTSASST